jgi:hypothetical protein
MKTNSRFLYLVAIAAIILSACKKNHDNDNSGTGHITFSFTHHYDGAPIQKDTLRYLNAAGNKLEINELRYFISDVTLYKSDGTTQLIKDGKDINYVDIDMPSTLTWDVFDEITTGDYDSISFTFGINEVKNKSFLFVNPPEVNMMWPDVLGGGYHYMMFNGKWKDDHDTVQNFDCHLGIGQLYKSNATTCIDSIYAFVQNYFRVSLPNSSFSIEKDSTTSIEMIMNLESWFTTPHVYDFNYWGGSIMQNQPAMQTIKENGFDVFSTGIIH